LKGRLALFYSGRSDSSDYYLRAATVHNRALETAQISREHAMLHALVMDDAIAEVPVALRSTVTSEHESTSPFHGLGELKARVTELRASGVAKATELWRALLVEKPLRGGDADGEPSSADGGGLAVDAILDGFQPHDYAVGVMTSLQRKDLALEETDGPFGETLLHAASHVGRVQLVKKLLAAGANPSEAGAISGCAPLHAAASRGHTAVCKELLCAGAEVAMLSNTAKRTALHLACLHGHTETARFLVSVGGADPYQCGQGGESVMALLRRLGTSEALGLLAALDELCGTSDKVDATSTVAATSDDADADAAGQGDKMGMQAVAVDDGIDCWIEYGTDEEDTGDDAVGSDEEDEDYEDDDDEE